MMRKLVFEVSLFSATILLLPMPSWGARDRAAPYEVNCALCDSSAHEENPAVKGSVPKGTADEPHRGVKEGKAISRARHHKDKFGTSVPQPEAILDFTKPRAPFRDATGLQFAIDSNAVCDRSDACSDRFDFDDLATFTEANALDGKDHLTSAVTFVPGKGSSPNTQVSTPEPPSLLLICAGLAGFIALRLKSIMARLFRRVTLAFSR
jgi:hypothetical protein